MELEQRVKLLEQEVKLLKNEIQATLLDIQEQLLSAHYPALRAEEFSAEMSAPHPAAGSNGQPDQAASPAPAMIKKVSLADLSDPPPVHARGDDTPETPGALPRGVPFWQTVSKVVKQPALFNPEKAPVIAKQPSKEASAAVDSPSPVDWETLDRLTQWTIHTVERLGFERTRQLIGVYFQQELLSEKAAKALVQIAATFKPNGANAEQEQAKNLAAEKAEKRNIVLRVIRRLVLPEAVQEAHRG